MRVPYLLLIHPTREEQRQRDEHHRNGSLQCTKEQPRLRSVLCIPFTEDTRIIQAQKQFDSTVLTLGGRKTNLYPIMTNNPMNVQRNAESQSLSLSHSHHHQ